jgi:serine/threonine protein kinase
MDLEAKIERSIQHDLADSSEFDRYFKLDRSLGKGSDGQVSAFLHRSSKRLIAVKIPRAGRYEASAVIHREAKALKAVRNYGKHENISHMIAYQSTYGVISCPAIFLEYAEFGSLLHYRLAWREQESWNKSPIDIPESTVWKLFKDMIFALNFLHNNCGLIHRDVKPDNILVSRSPTDYGSVVPAIPVFKLADFSRAVAYPSAGKNIYGWAGSVDYAPPLTERQKDEPARPAGDMWSLGATLQDFALGISPRQSRKAFVEQMDQWQEPHPKLDGDEELWATNEWKSKFCAAYRPLNLKACMLEISCDVTEPLARDYKPFSDILNKWYRRMWVVDPELRATSASLLKELMPFIDCYIGVSKKPETHRTDSMLVMQDVVPELARPQAPTPKRMMGGLRMPSYEGNDYGPLSSELRLREID